MNINFNMSGKLVPSNLRRPGKCLSVVLAKMRADVPWDSLLVAGHHFRYVRSKTDLLQVAWAERFTTQADRMVLKYSRGFQEALWVLNIPYLLSHPSLSTEIIASVVLYFWQGQSEGSETWVCCWVWKLVFHGAAKGSFMELQYLQLSGALEFRCKRTFCKVLAFRSFMPSLSMWCV